MSPNHFFMCKVFLILFFQINIIMMVCDPFPKALFVHGIGTYKEFGVIFGSEQVFITSRSSMSNKISVFFVKLQSISLFFYVSLSLSLSFTLNLSLSTSLSLYLSLSYSFSLFFTLFFSLSFSFSFKLFPFCLCLSLGPTLLSLLTFPISLQQLTSLPPPPPTHTHTLPSRCYVFLIFLMKIIRSNILGFIL